MSRTHVPVALTRFVTERAKGQCEYCRSLSRFSHDPFAIEHILPEAEEGATEQSNLALSCIGCNSFKGAFTTGVDETTGREVALFHPRHQKWSDHFAWNTEATEIIGLSATGRATINRLRLNRPGLINLRTALRQFGVHPPESLE